MDEPEPWSSGVGSDHYSNYATTTVLHFTCEYYLGNLFTVNPNS